MFIIFCLSNVKRKDHYQINEYFIHMIFIKKKKKDPCLYTDSSQSIYKKYWYVK